MKQGDMVCYTVGGLGTLRREDSNRFTDYSVREGQTGWYIGPMPDIADGDTWHLTAIEVNGETLYVPVAPSMFESVNGGDSA